MQGAPDVGTYFFTQGILGVIVVVLGIVCIKLYNKVQELQDARLLDAKEVTKDVTTVLKRSFPIKPEHLRPLSFTSLDLLS